MNRRKFIFNSSLASAGWLAAMKMEPDFFALKDNSKSINDIYRLFKSPPLSYHPFVRWWWNGNKVEAAEIVRELRLLKDAGIGGVEINPIEFPSRFPGDDIGKTSLRWLSNDWIAMLKTAFDEAKSLGMTCDLITGSGWPFGSEDLKEEERAQTAVIAVKKITGPFELEISRFALLKEADPAISSPFPGRTPELLSLSLVPDPIGDPSQITDLSHLKGNDTLRITIPPGKHALYALVRIKSFMQVIDGAPGATGPVVNHYDSKALKSYLYRMSDSIRNATGPLSVNLRSLFTDSLELEGSNWFEGIMEEFMEKNGYDIFPYLPFVLFKTGAMGNVTDPGYAVSFSPRFDEMIKRMRFDFEVFKADKLAETYIDTFTGWCRELGVKSRGQAYGRGLYQLESSMSFDIPECESWTMNWLKHRIGEEMPEDDYRRGRAYTMINKYVSSAAHLSGKRLVSCEEMTDTYKVFNTTLEDLKVGGDQSAISGVTHSVFHGFNYSPPEAPYPGWIRYGCYYNEKNTWWPWFHIFNSYKARMSAILRNVTFCADIAILPPLDDMWSNIGTQMEPFPSVTNCDWFTLVWEAINKNGNGSDYISRNILKNAVMKDGTMHYGERKYTSIFLVQVESLDTGSAAKLLEFIKSGGRIFCIETIPSKSLGWNNNIANDATVRNSVEAMKAFPERFIFIRKPEKDYIGWFRELQRNYGLKPGLEIEKPDPYVYQNRYIADDGSELFLIVNSNIHNTHITRIKFPGRISAGRHCNLWDPETGERYLVRTGADNSIELVMGPSSSFLFALEPEKAEIPWKQLSATGTDKIIISGGWKAEFVHCRDGSVQHADIDNLRNIREVPGFETFAGVIIYRNTIELSGPEDLYINPGKVFGVAELMINGKDCGTLWYGRRTFAAGEFLVEGKNLIEIRVATTMGNYMKSLTDNPVAQYWTNEKNKVQPWQTVGLLGPVELFRLPVSH